MPEQTVPSGISVLDERLGGLVPGGVHVVSGGPGTGKTVLGLQFLAEGIRRGERVAHVTQARPEDVVELADSLGLDLAAHLESGDWLLLGYQPGFRERYRRALEPGLIFDELRDFLPGEPGRLLLDTATPLVQAREPGTGAAYLVELVERLGGTTLLTFTAEEPGGLDSGLDDITQRAAVILHLSVTESGQRRCTVRKAPRAAEPGAPIDFEIRSDGGIIRSSRVGGRRASDVPLEVQRRVLLLDLAAAELPAELRSWFEESFDLSYFSDPVDAFPELARHDFGLVAVNVDRESVERAIHITHQLRRAAGRPPLLIMCPYDVRASDRARALRLGADDFVSGGLHPEELASRIQALLRRGRTDTEEPEDGNGSARADVTTLRVEPTALRDLARRMHTDTGVPVFSLVLMAPGTSRSVGDLAEHVLGVMRKGTGDRLSVMDDRVVVYLESALAGDVEHFLERVRVRPWKRVDVESYTAPTDRERIHDLLDEMI